jgi:hypothetical protein
MVLVSPPCPAIDYFREWRIWSSLHLFAWAVKDCFWAWDLPTAYAMGFGVTVSLNVDHLYRLACHKHQYTSFVQYFVVLLWVLANGVWALGELTLEGDLAWDAFREYRFVGSLLSPEFLPRRLAGWFFVSAAGVLVAFYVQWVVVTHGGTTISYKDFIKLASK